MQVILRENVENLGHIGDLVNVSEGYARNFLLPRKLVMIADENNIKQIEATQKALEKKRQAQKADAEAIAKKLADFSCTIKKKVGEHDKLFGSVSTSEIADALAKGGFAIKKGAIHLEHPIKALGVHTASVKLAPEVTASVKVWVAKEE